MADNVVVCIARQFGSGGHEIGLALAKDLGFEFYDKELLKQAADKSGIVQELIEKADEKPTTGLHYSSAAMGNVAKVASFADYVAYMPNNRIQNVIAEVIRDAAAQSSCVIIGRCADYILRGHKGTISVFVHASLDVRIQRVAKMNNQDEDEARALIRKTDRSKANYYSFYTDRDWGGVTNYDFSLDSGKLGIQQSVELIKTAVGLFVPAT